MSALPNSTIETGVFLPSGLKAWEEIGRRFAVVRDRRGDLRSALVELGLALLEVQKRGVPHGSWGQMLQAHGIPINTSKSAIRAAKEHLGLIPKRRSDAGKVGSVGTEPEQSGTMVPNDGVPDEGLTDDELDASLDEIPCAGPEEIAALNRMYGITEEDGVDGTVTVDAQGLGTVAPAAALAGEPPVARDGAVAGRIGPEELPPLPAARRRDVAGQLTLVGDFAQVESLMVAAQMRGGDVQRRASEAAARFRRELSEILGEAA